MSATETPAGKAPADADVASSFRCGEDRDSGGTLDDDGLLTGCSVILCTYARPEDVRRFLESLRLQTRRPDELIVIDASSDTRTELVVREQAALEGPSVRVVYDRVSGSRRGLTRQRNFGLSRAAFDLAAFFDDDTVLDPKCLAELEQTLRRDDRAVGAGGFVVEDGPTDRRLWSLRRALGIVGDLVPGRYCRSGMSIPWSFLPPGEEGVEGDWLPGCAMMWRTAPARRVRFNEGFAGYAQGEDLDFSLRMRTEGRLVLTQSARLQHLHAPHGRPDHARLGYMAIRNRYEIHRRGLADRTARDVAWFAYAWTLDTLLLARQAVRPDRWSATLRQVAGRAQAAFELIRGR